MADLVLLPLNLQEGSYTAQQDRLNADAFYKGVGVCGPLDFRCSFSVGSTLTFTTAVGKAFIKGNSVSNQGLYQVTDLVGTSGSVDTNSGGANPRIDQIVLRVYDSTEAGGIYDKASIEVLKGTVTASASLNNRSGVATLPASCILLADVLLNAGATTISGYRDRRPFSKPVAIPPILTNLTTPVVSFEDPPGITSEYAQGSVTAAGISVNDNTKQCAVLQYLPNRIESATRIRFRYVQGSTAIAAGNWIISIFDASGRLIVSTSSTAFTGSANSIQNISATITATTFEAGLYYVHVGTTGSTASSFVNFLGANPKTAFAPNLCFHATSGGVTVPTTLLSMVDSYTIDPIATRIPYVPKVALSVG